MSFGSPFTTLPSVMVSPSAVLYSIPASSKNFVVETLSVLLVNKPPRVRSPNVTAIITITIIAVLADFFI